MAKKLKLGFAMGGGVSLGIFSGVALAEVLKQTIAYGKDEEGKPFESVEVDVFSGASAGSMSLSIMLRTLAAPLNEYREEAISKVQEEFKDVFSSLSPKNQQDLIAAQVVQLVQEKIWIEEINLNRLLSGNIRHKGSILNRDAVDEIAIDYFNFSNEFVDGKIPFSDKRILGDRVLFASTLANLTPMTYDAREEFKTSKVNYPGLEDGLTSKVHKDIRIFDLHFYDLYNNLNIQQESKLCLDNGLPNRWCRYHVGKQSEGAVGKLNTQKTWNKIVATSIACGAFPLGFEPVVLNRSEWEYPSSVWPKELKEAHINKYPFTYVDGGTFNNEPIREAFRLASFLDSKEQNNDFERRIVFVDPILGKDNTNFRIKIHKDFTFDVPGKLSAGKTKVVKKTAFDKILTQAGTILSSIMSQARSNESDKIYASFKAFEYRKEARKIIGKFFNDLKPERELFVSLKTRVQEFLAQAKIDELIPSGNMSLHGELHRVIIEEAPTFQHLEGKEQEFIDTLEPEKLKYAKDWLKLLMFIKIDHLMNISKKDEKAKLIAIAPIQLQDGVYKGGNLPGGLVEGFGGFTSEIPSKFEAKLAKWCTKFMLQQKEVNLIQTKKLPEIPTFSESEWEQYLPDLTLGMENLSNRIDQIIKDKAGTTLDIAYWAFVQSTIKDMLTKIDPTPSETLKFQYMVHVPEMGLEVNGKERKYDIETIRIEGVPTIYFELKYDVSNSKWIGNYVDYTQQIRIDLDGVFRDKAFCHIPLPTKNQVLKANLYPNPIFKIELKNEDKGRFLSSSDWEIHPGVTSLDKLLVPNEIQPA